MRPSNPREATHVSTDPDFERWNGRFAATGDYVFGTEPNAFLVAQRHRLKPGMRALALADGEGRNGVWLARQGLHVLSVDFSPAGLEKAQRLAARYGVAIETECADLRHWHWEPERFDVVVAILIQFTKPPLQGEIFRGMKAALRHGGLVILQGYRPEQLRYGTGGPPSPISASSTSLPMTTWRRSADRMRAPRRSSTWLRRSRSAQPRIQPPPRTRSLS